MTATAVSSDGWLPALHHNLPPSKPESALVHLRARFASGRFERPQGPRGGCDEPTTKAPTAAHDQGRR